MYSLKKERKSKEKIIIIIIGVIKMTNILVTLRIKKTK